MNDPYQPSADFLLLVLDDAIALEDHPLASANRAHLIRYTCDADPANRDWAVFLIAQSNLDGDDVRAALTRALDDANETVRDEALVGLAKRDRSGAEPRVLAALNACWINDLVIEAAAHVASPRLVPVLAAIAALRENDDPEISSRIAEAINYCERGVPPDC